MIVSEELTADLRKGLSLDAVLKKHGTNLKEVFNSKPVKSIKPVRKPKYYYYDKRADVFIVQKRINGERIYFGRYHSEEAAQYAVKLLVECDWDPENNWRIRAEVNEYIKRRKGGL